MQIPAPDAHQCVIGVAIALPSHYAAQVRAVREAAGDPLAVVVPPHITLLPPTAIDVDSLDEVKRHPRNVAAGTRPVAGGRLGRALNREGRVPCMVRRFLFLPRQLVAVLCLLSGLCCARGCGLRGLCRLRGRQTVVWGRRGRSNAGGVPWFSVFSGG